MSNRKAVERLLILAARLELPAEERAEMRSILQEGLDWAGLVSEGSRLGVAPLLHRHLSKGEERLCVPPDILAALAKEHRAQSIRNMLIYGALLTILRAMDERSIPVILLKGAFLVTHLYPDMALRPMSDIDLLCRPEDAFRAQELLLSFGYRQSVPSCFLNAVHERVLARSRCHLPQITNGVVRVEVHSMVFDKVSCPTFPPESLWRESWESAVGGASFRCLCAEHQLLHLCTHLCRHMSTGGAVLYWFCDIHEILKKYEHSMNWKKFYHIARELRVSKQVQSVLNIMKCHWGSPVSLPEDGSASHSPFDFLQTKKRMRVYYYFRHISEIKNIESMWDRFLFLWGSLFPSNEFMSRRYNVENKAVLALYYAYRPVAFMAKIMASLLLNILYALKKCR